MSKVVMSLGYSGAEPQPSLAWTFESSNVDIVTGLTPSAQVSPGPAQLVGGASLVTTVAGVSNTAVSFNGTSGYMNLGSTGPTTFNTNSSNLFVEAWVYVTSGTVARIYGRATSITAVAPDYDFTFRFSTGSLGVANGTVVVTAPGTMTNGTWNHCALSITTTGRATVFLNGQAGTSTTITMNYRSAYPTFIGAMNGDYMNGFIRDLRVVQGGIVPVAQFTPLASAPFSYASPSYVANMGTTVFTLLGQFVTYNPSGKYGSSLKIQNYPVGGKSNVYINWTSSITSNLYSPGLTVSTWIKYDSLVAGNYTPELSVIWNIGDAYFVQWNNAGGAAMGDGAGNFPSTYTNLNPVIGTWRHYTAVYGNGRITTYLNGSQVSTSTFTNAQTVLNTVIQIGTSGASGSMCAEYDDLRIYNTALTAAQVQSVYSSQGAPAPSRAMPLPKLAWDFNGTTTDYVSGLSGTTTGTISYTPGKFNQGISFNNASGTGGNNVYYAMTSMPVDSGITVSLWVKFNQLQDSYFCVMSNITFKTQGAGMNWFMVNNGQYPGGYLANYAVNTWYHLVLSIGNMSVGAYFNGSLQATTAYTTSGTTVNGPRIGAEYNSGINGTIDDLRIFDRALTSAQVQSIYNQQGVPGRGVNSKVVPTFTVSDQSQSPINFQTYRTDGPIPTSSSSPFGGTEGSFAPTILTFNSIFPSTISKLNFDFFSPTSKSFMECWVYVPSVTNYPRIWFRQIGLSGNPSWGDFLFFLNPSPGKVGLILSTGTSTINSFLSSVNYITNSWNHISMSWDNTNTTAYISVNGSVSSQSQSGRTSEYTSSSSIQFGVFFDAGSLMSNFRLVQNATTLPYITNGFTVPTAPLPIYPTGTTALLLRSVSPLTMFSGGAIQSATGGNTVQDIGGFRIHTFTTVGTSTFTPSTAGNVEVLVVAGGGGGAVRHAGGGGAGGLIYNSSFTVSGAVSVTVGDGGAGLPQGTNAAVPGNPGSNSVFGSLTSIGGGGGNGGAGGSGGGGGATGTGGAGTPGQGNNGAFGSTGPFTGQNAYGGGGGGGAGAAGTNSTSVAPVQAGAGGIGLQYSISGTPVYYAGGGGGGTTIADGGGAGGAGGLGGGGAGGGSNSIVGISGTNGTGGGGGAGGFANVGGNYASGKGGSGIVIVRYPLPIRLTGTPLFTQLSPAATSSAVGAFSLRAVNATTARAVQVRPQAEFPPVAMTSNDPQNMTGYSFGGSGNYTASSSTGTAWSAFDNNPTTFWETTGSPSNLTYNTLENGGVYIGSVTTTIDGVSTAGEWIQLELPSAITIVNYSMYARSGFTTRMSRNFTLAGSNDGTSWTTVNTQTNITSWSGQTPITFTVNSSVFYKYFRLVVTAVVGSSGSNQRLDIAGITYTGSPPAQDFYADRLGNLLTAPVTGRSLANWLGGATGYVRTWYDQSGRGNHAEQTTAANQPVIQRATKGPGYSCLFSGNQWVNYGTTATFAGTPFSVIAVNRRTVGTTYTSLMGWGNTGATLTGWQTVYFTLNETNDRILSQVRDGGTTIQTNIPIFTSSVLEPVRYVTLDFNNSFITRQYLDGSVPIASSAVSGFLNSSASGIGSIGSGLLNYFTGEIYELLVFTQSLYDLDGTSTITQIYQNQLGAYGT